MPEPNSTETAVVSTTVPSGIERYDPFSLMDHLDEQALIRELEGIATDDLVYVVKDRGQEVTGLSKGGVDECCNILAHQGEVIREDEPKFELRGEGEDRVGYFTVMATRYVVSKDAREVKLDRVSGVKAQPLYRETALELTLDSPCKLKKFRAARIKDADTGEERSYTWRDVLEEDASYVEWVSENYGDETVKEFAKRILNGEDVRIEPGRKFNKFWYEHGAMKAARNARFRLIPADIKAMVIARAKQTGKGVKQVDATGEPVTPPPAEEEKVATPKQRERITELLNHPVITEDEAIEITEWLDDKGWTFGCAGAAIDRLKKRIATREKNGDAEGKDSKPSSQPADTPDTTATTAPHATRKSKPSSPESDTNDSTDSDETPEESDPPRFSKAVLQIREDIDALLERASKKTKRVWEGFYLGLVEHGGTVDDFKKVRRALQDAESAEQKVR